MNIFDELNDTQKKLSRLEDERDRVLKPLEDDLLRAQHQGIKGEALAQISERLETQKKLSDNIISEVQAQVSRLSEKVRIQEDAQRAKAKEEINSLKVTAQKAWLNSGGNLAGFAAAWPQMEADILKAKTLAAITPETGITPERAASVRNFYSGKF